ncbi:NAC domain-containing protein 104 [Vitis vinifera]|uniref:NAC domain-containing protein 104 n=1 Tax=Vitis vinifera TaxID=29760 RepID=A0A438HQU8_VITVI|nr:NAC domain-containing protein 104 [Vitis vinifera]
MKMEEGSINLPPGFQFYPTDEELVLDFLYRKASLLPCYPNIIPDLDSYVHDPWELNGKALSSGSQWYFFSQKTQDRATKNGYWKQLDIDEAIYTSAGKKVGIKKYLLFYMGEAPEGIETNWIMQEYSLSNSGLGCTSYKRIAGKKILDGVEWVLCRVYERKSSQHGFWCDEDDDDGTELSCLDEIFLSLDDDLDEISLPN